MGGVGTTATAGGMFRAEVMRFMQAAARLGTNFLECGSWAMITTVVEHIVSTLERKLTEQVCWWRSEVREGLQPPDAVKST